MRRLKTSLAMSVSLAVLWSTSAFAYIGPGAGITVLGALWGVVVAIALTVGAVVLWPFRVLLRRFRKRPVKKPSDETTAATREPEGNKTGQSDAIPPRKPG